jgi:hypothetical protein
VKAYTVPREGACNTLLDNDTLVVVMLDFQANPRAIR